MDKYIGRLLDNRYEILEVIGTGGMAVVYKARCHRLNRLVAIKILKDDFLQDEEFRRRFHAESHAVAMLSHPNIVQVYDVSTSDEADYIVMELIDGISLKQYMEKKGVLNWKETLHFAMQIARALEHAHGRGVVHRDIKPHNVMVLKNGSVKVTDFGIARMMSKGNTLTKEALGSVHYISPEQAKGGRVDNRSDIYSLGVVMYEMMAGRPPYDGETPVAVAIQHINGGAAMPSTLNPNIPGGLEQIIMKAMALGVEKRYVSAAEMVEAMDAFRKDPTILFDYNTPPLDAVTMMPKPPLVLEPEKPAVTTAELVAGKSDNRPGTSQRTSEQLRQQQERRRQQQERERARRNRTATIAIISCCAAIVIAIVVILVLTLGGNSSAEPDQLTVPNLVGEIYDTLPEYPGFAIKLLKEEFSSEVPAGEIISHEPEAGDEVTKTDNPYTIYVVVSKGVEPEAVKMQDVVGQKKDQVKMMLDSMSLKLQVKFEEEYSDTVAEDCIIRTDPAEGAELTEGQKITLYVSIGKNIKTTTMMDLVDKTLDSAKKTLDVQELELEIKTAEINDNNIAEGKVVKTEPAAGEKLKTGQTVTLYISKGPEKKAMPNVTGLSVEKAIDILDTAGFKNYEIVTVENEKEKDTVVKQSIEKNVETPVTEKIVLEVSSGPAPEETTEATTAPQEVTKSLLISNLPTDIENSYWIQIVNKYDSTEKYIETVQPGQQEIEVAVTGKGIQVYKIIINNEEERELSVNFDE